MELIDITVTLHEGVPRWPGSCGFKRKLVSDLAHGDFCNGSEINMDVHVGTHIDAPWHFLQDGLTGDQLPLSHLIGPAYVAQVSETEVITAANLAQLQLPPGTRRLLLKTVNSQLWADDVREFQKNFVALAADAAQWVVDQGIELIGIDYLSIQRFGDSARTHEVLLEAEVVILEGIDLHHVSPGEYELICLPLKIQGGDGLPARAVLRRG